MIDIDNFIYCSLKLWNFHILIFFLQFLADVVQREFVRTDRWMKFFRRTEGKESVTRWNGWTPKKFSYSEEGWERDSRRYVSSPSVSSRDVDAGVSSSACWKTLWPYWSARESTVLSRAFLLHPLTTIARPETRQSRVTSRVSAPAQAAIIITPVTRRKGKKGTRGRK